MNRKDVIIKKSKVQGIHYKRTNISSCTYLSIMHEASGMVLYDITPMPTISVSKIILFCDNVLSKQEWNIKPDELTKGHKDLYYYIRDSLRSLDFVEQLKLR